MQQCLSTPYKVGLRCSRDAGQAAGLPSLVSTMLTLMNDLALKDEPDSPVVSCVAQPLAFKTAKMLPLPSCLLPQLFSKQIANFES